MITGSDTNILIDILEPDPDYGPASKEALKHSLHQGSVLACEVVWAEVTAAYSHKKEAVVDALRHLGIAYSAMTLEAALKKQPIAGPPIQKTPKPGIALPPIS